MVTVGDGSREPDSKFGLVYARGDVPKASKHDRQADPLACPRLNGLVPCFPCRHRMCTFRLQSTSAGHVSLKQEPHELGSQLPLNKCRVTSRCCKKTGCGTNKRFWPWLHRHVKVPRIEPSVSACLLDEDRVNGGLRNASGPLPTPCSSRPRTSVQACVYGTRTRPACSKI